MGETNAARRFRKRHHSEHLLLVSDSTQKTARKEAAEQKLVEVRDERDTALLAQVHAQQMAEVEAQLKNLTMQQAAEQAKFEQSWKVREKSLWDRIEAGIKVEQDKEFARLEAERKVREEEERKRQEEENKRKEEERKKEEEVKRKEQAEKQKKEAEEKQRQDERQRKAADEEQKRKEDQQRQADTQAAQAKDEQAKALGGTTAMDDWRAARENLMRLKNENTRVAKANPQAKSTWGNLRRQVVRKVGQVTNDEAEITRISNEIIDLANSASGSSILLNAFYSSIAKAILLQAETEVTAEKASALPIARVAHRLLATLDGLADVFFAKLVQRVGGWPVPAIPPSADFDGRQWKDSHERFGYRVSQDSGAMETTPQHIERVTGVMRVYFHILATPPGDKPIASRFFQTPRYWVWFARVLGSRSLLASDVCVSLMHAALEIFGADARKIWGKQWTKVLALIYDLVQNGIGEGKPLGGTSPEGTAGRLRVKLEIDKIMGVSS
ncbi:GLE1-like protein-domain-containing protein [Schizophyllum commune]